MALPVFRSAPAPARAPAERMAPMPFAAPRIFLLLCAASLVACGQDEVRRPGAEADVAVADAGPSPDAAVRDVARADTPEGVADTGAGDLGPQSDAAPDAPEIPYCGEGGEGWQRDADRDGLSDCREEQMCTSLDSHDTDQDGLTDLEETQGGTDPCRADSDGDGLSDFDERRYGLDPNRASTYADAVLDADRWIVGACEEATSEPVDFYASPLGRYKLALPPVYNNHALLTVSTATPQNMLGASFYDDPAAEVAGMTFTFAAMPSLRTPIEVLTYYRARVGALGSVLQDSTGAPFDTHNFHKAATASYRIRTGSAKSARQLREELLFRLAPFGADVTTGLPATAGTTYQEFRILVTAVHRGHSVATLVAIAPAARYEQDNKIKFRMDDLTNTTALSGASDSPHMRCTTFRSGLGVPKVDFYWVLDQSGSMYDDFERVRSVANTFYARLNNTALDYRLGVANMSENFNGRLRYPPAWHTELPTFLGQIETHVVQCSGCGSNSAWAEWGLQSARQGIEFMRSAQAPQATQIRPDAQLVTIFMSDEEDQGFQENAITTATGQVLLNDYLTFFAANTAVFSIVSQGGNCGDDAQGYIRMALGTGGTVANLCSADIGETIEEIIYSATGLASTHVLQDVPVSSSLRVFKNGEWVPRSRENGFDYFANTNAIAFYGRFRPLAVGGGPQDHLSVTYQRYVVSNKPERAR